MIYSHLWMDGKRAFFQATNALHGPSPITVPETAINRTGLVHVGFDLSRHGMVEGRQIDSSLSSWSRVMADYWPRCAASTELWLPAIFKKARQSNDASRGKQKGKGTRAERVHRKHFRTAL